MPRPDRSVRRTPTPPTDDPTNTRRTSDNERPFERPRRRRRLDLARRPLPSSGSTTGNLADPDPRPARRRGHHQPDDLRQGDLRRRTPTTSRSSGWPPQGVSTSTRRSARSPPTTSATPRDVLKPVYDDTDGVDGRVSIEVEPGLAHDTAKTIAAGQGAVGDRRPAERLHQDPGHQGGHPGDHRDAGRRDQRQRDADLLARALQGGRGRVPDRPRAGARQRPRRDQAGQRWPRSSSAGSTPRSTSDSTPIGTDEAKALKGKAAIANARLAFEAYEEIFASDRWHELEAAGAKPQRPLWASTGVKDPAYPTPCTSTSSSPPASSTRCRRRRIDAVADHGEITGDTVRGTYDAARAGDRRPGEARHLLRRRRRRCSRTRASSKFDASWSELQDTVTDGPRRRRPSERRAHRRPRTASAGTDVVDRLVSDKVASRIAAKDADGLGSGGRVRVRDPAGLGRPAPPRRAAAGRDRGAPRPTCGPRASTGSSSAGMGGSSLAPEVITRTAGRRPRRARHHRPEP